MLEKSNADQQANPDEVPKPALHLAGNISNKRRRDNEPESELESFQVLPSLLSRLNKPINATGQLIIPRASLSLSFLDPICSPHILLNTRFFSAYIESLEGGQLQQASQRPEYGSRVLIAKLECDDVLYAIERAGSNLYSICRLARWVDEESLRSLRQRPEISASYSTSRVEPSFPKHADGEEWWSPFAIIRNDIQQPKRRKINNELETVETAEKQTSVSDAQLSVPEVGLANSSETTLGSIEAVPIQQPRQDVFKNLVGQYLNALYVSNTSLAYFAKGPLSRARATFNAENTLKELHEFLDSLILNISTADKKYKTSIPNIVNSSVTPNGKSISKPKKKWKTKPDRNGLFLDEMSFIMAWWRTDNSQASLSECISRIRFRETLLQVTLVLEILTLDTMISATNAPTEASRTPKKSKDLQKHIDVLIDRLTIWQSVELGDDTGKNVESKSLSTGGTSKPGESSDQLKEFCLQVVVPFYNARLPDTVDRLTTKLGAPTGISPARRISGPRNPCQNVAPGTELARQKPNKSKMGNQPINGLSIAGLASLVRSGSDSTTTKAANTSHIGGHTRKERQPLSRSQSINQSVDRRKPLSRSNSIGQVKDSQGKDRSRRLSRSSSVSQTNNNLKQREVDFSAIGKFYQAKLKKKIDVEQELKEAISALKKPNRDLAGKEYMEAAHVRVSTAKLQRTSHISRRKGAAGVEVNATPRRLNKQSSIAVTPDKDASKLTGGLNDSRANPCIPSSTLHPPPFKDPPSSGQLATTVSSTPLGKSGSRPVFETPSRGNGNTPWRLQVLQDSMPRLDRSGTAFQTPIKASSFKSMTPRKAVQPQSTQNLKQDSEQDAAAKTAGSTQLESDFKQESIYETLGWDDFDELM